ncbi:hypothetical protein IWX49DRAFT_583210 [Phyllosticta citricarpa]|uniref:Uncharacterized protein n=1 Tax=Phyllosticta citricarpa TaxID=55181 RepID=A0ABR1M1N4_9PEZI
MAGLVASVVVAICFPYAAVALPSFKQNNDRDSLACAHLNSQETKLLSLTLGNKANSAPTVSTTRAEPHILQVKGNNDLSLSNRVPPRYLVGELTETNARSPVVLTFPSRNHPLLFSQHTTYNQK